MRAAHLLTVIVLVAAAGCLERHANTDAFADNDCYACHRNNYEQARDPVHVGAMPTECRDCHSTIAWRPAGLHPNDRFPIRTGPHAAADCGACHKAALGPPQGGANTDCLTCHLEPDLVAPHAGEPTYVYDPATPHDPCLRCHPDGLKHGHPEDRFPIANGPHQLPCADCHIRATGLPDSGGMNVTCTGCHTGQHTRARADNDHQEVSGYAWSDADPQFCRRCHPNGRH